MQNNPVDPLAGIQAESQCLGGLRLIREARVLTLSTLAISHKSGSESPASNPRPSGCQSGVWSAPVYYIFKKGSFYFFSNPGSRHIEEGAGEPAAASVFMDDNDPAKLRGLQMVGGIESCSRDEGGGRIWDKEAAGAALTYAARYGIKTGPGNMLHFFKKKFHAALYKFVPESAWYMDNQQGMGNRTQIQL